MELSNSEFGRSKQSWIKGQDKDSSLKLELVPFFDASIKIRNVVAVATLNQKFDLNAIVRENPLVDYNPAVFPGLVFKLRKPRTSILIFRTGKMVCTGAKSEKKALKAIKKVIKELQINGIIIPGKPEIKIVNIVASANLLGKIELEDVAYSLNKTMYEPEQFPGLIYRMDDPKVVILIFATGKLVCTGAKKEAEVYRAVENLRQQLENNDLIFYSKDPSIGS
jgi:transcription initiation factor TFIID TATA-box-binding protein